MQKETVGQRFTIDDETAKRIDEEGRLRDEKIRQAMSEIKLEESGENL